MFDIERWQEIFDIVRKNKLLIFLRGISVVSGVVIPIVLLEKNLNRHNKGMMSKVGTE
ncbi:hypothetical protein [Maribacter sp. 2304DJ31-5]|uniref:hypothetical protein n=1 Tax=Maribacter sp. 2304DJ31-5 TaxID=3386273 RepID=UPI0039BD8F20